MILTIDVGGTKTLLALYNQQGDSWRVEREKKYQSAAYHGISGILADFASQEIYQQVSVICAGVAGPVVGGVCHITNLSWSLSVSELQRVTDVGPVFLLNDLEATAWGVRYLDDGKFLDINQDAKPEQGNIAILSAGTGLGEAMLIRNGRHVTAVATEGGHADFAPQNEEQDKLLVYLRKKYHGHVSYERLVSGEGLYNIYQYLRSLGNIIPSEKLEQHITLNAPAAVIGEAGLAETDALSIEAVRLFCQIYAAEAANLALKCLPYAGVVLAGGITPKLLPAIKQQYFMDAFLDKGRYRDLLKKIPVRVCMDESIVLSGALAFARHEEDKG